jgi:hypothetical protein
MQCDVAEGESPSPILTHEPKSGVLQASFVRQGPGTF